MPDYTERNMLERVEQPVIWIAAPGVQEFCALCEEPIQPGETIVEGCGDEVLHIVCVSFAQEDCGGVQ